MSKRPGLAKGTAQQYPTNLEAERANGEKPKNSTPATPERQDVPLDEITLIFDTQARVAIHGDIVNEYAEAMAAGEKFPPVILFRDDEGYWVGDGHHRCRAARQVGFTTIQAEVRAGGPREAFLYACSANVTHGLRRGALDKRHVVHTLLTDEEWGQWSDREIARRCAVSHPYVGKLRAELAERRARLSGNGYQMPETRTVHRGEATYTMDTTRIGTHEVTTAPVNGTPGTTRAIAHAPITGPEADGDDDAEDDVYTVYLDAWERLRRAHDFWVRHVDGPLINKLAPRRKADMSRHIKELRALADGLQHYAKGMEWACEQ
jgi:hypothetical protein